MLVEQAMAAVVVMAEVVVEHCNVWAPVEELLVVAVAEEVVV